MWLEWYIAGVVVGICVAVIAIYMIARRQRGVEMIWSMVGSMLMFPLLGIFLAGAAFMLMR